MSRPETNVPAKVQETSLGFEDHGLITAVVQYDGGSWGQAAPLFMFGRMDGLSPPQNAADDDEDAWVDAWVYAGAMGIDFIRRMLYAHGVDRWEDLVGRQVLIDRNDRGMISAIRPMPFNNGTVFDIDQWAAAWRARKETT